MFPQTPRRLVQRSPRSLRKHLISSEEVKARIGNAIGPYQDPPDVSENTQTEVVRARHTIIWTGRDYPTGNSSKRETKR